MTRRLCRCRHGRLVGYTAADAERVLVRVVARAASMAAGAAGAR